ncbi:hypothetical protein L1987_06035 [Smallanthus sonchifolius]|uniref:Uncharacterized protein n=1 Tax=Smallanthus sonchifolius TaxID=185202 RepID=A0ACB9JX36_9ASTR|nr:hypothetical protein L1987_06035 [Smallanthus sonchifolius]
MDLAFGFEIDVVFILQSLGFSNTCDFEEDLICMTEDKEPEHESVDKSTWYKKPQKESRIVFAFGPEFNYVEVKARRLKTHPITSWLYDTRRKAFVIERSGLPAEIQTFLPAIYKIVLHNSKEDVVERDTGELLRMYNP